MADKAIAITGMACIFPEAYDLDSYWRNILAGKSAIRPIPENRKPHMLIEEDDEENTIKCTHGAFLDEEIPFTPLEYGVMPSLCDMGDPEQLLMMQLAHQALVDTGINPEKEDLKNTEIIIGRGGYLGGYLQQGFQKVEMLPQIIDLLHQLVPGVSMSKLAKIRKELKTCFAHITAEKSILGIPNINTGRIANRFNMMGANYTIDAACASTLIAAENAVMSLRQERCERVITGGSFLASNPALWWVFSRLDAISKNNGIKPFSKLADGMLPGEGIGILVFERLEDAVNAGRRIYAVVKGIGTSSDGRGAGVLAPRREGQLECLRRAYQDAGIDPKTVELLEGHGTATKIGDKTELGVINEFFGLSVDGIPTRALGSVKSMIGHTMPASGAASLIKMALSLYHKILPPTLCDGDVADILTNSSFYLNTATRPWVHPLGSKRRAGINAFGFGGINGHAVLEEYNENSTGINDLVMNWPMELFLLAGNTIDELWISVQQLIEKQKQYSSDNKLFGLLSRDVCQNGNKFLNYRLAIIAEDYESLSRKLRKALKLLKSAQGRERIEDDGIYFETEPLKKNGKIAFVFPGNAFPGLGDDYTDRLGELCLYFPFFRDWFDRLEQEKVLNNKSYRFSTMLFPPTKIEHEKYVRLKKELRILDHSASGVFLANTAGHDLISRLGVQPDMITGTSLGEWSAAVSAGMIELNQIAEMQVYAKSDEIDKITGSMGLVQCSLETLQPYFDEFNREEVTVTCSMDLSPGQVAYAGARAQVERFCRVLNEAGLWSAHLNLFPIHTPLCQPIADHIYKRLDGLRVSKPVIPAYSAATNQQFPTDAEEMRKLLADNAILPVYMRSLFLKLYKKGARIFLQLGGGGKVKAPIQETLGDRPFTVLSLDVGNRHPIHQLQHVLASLYAHHTEIRTDILYESRFRSLERSAIAKDKRSELVINLKTTIPRYQIKNERLHLERETNESMKGEVKKKNQQAEMQQITEAASSFNMTEWEELLCEQMDTMTRLYALQKEDELADIAHFSNIMKCQAQLILSDSGNNTKPFNFGNTADERQEKSFPFVGEIETHVHNKKIVIRRTISLESDLFIKDHAFIPCPDHIKPPEERIPALPMAVALEIISEASQTLFPGKIVCGLKNIKNKKWINLTEIIREKELVITAEVKDEKNSGEIEVNCIIAVEGIRREICFAGSVLLADHHYAYDKTLSLGEELKAARYFDSVDPDTLYRPGGLYHGACFRGLETILKTTDKGVEALLNAPPLDGFFANHSGLSMILPVQIIDAASQQIYCYDIAMKTRNRWVAPVSIERILIYKPAPMPGCKVTSKLIIRSNDTNLVRFDVLLETNDEVFMIIIGWRDWRTKWSDRLGACWQDPAGTLLSRKMQNRNSVSKNYWTVYSIEPGDLFGIDPDWLARFYLNSSEYRDWYKLSKDKQNGMLMEYIAVKDAARGLLHQKQKALFPSQVTVKQVSKGLFSIRSNGSGVSHSIPLSVITAKQDNKIIAMAVSEQIEELPELHSDLLEGEWSEFIMENYVQ